MTMIEVTDLTKQFGALTALDHVSLNIETGRIVGLLGPNGSGKTTFIKIANGLLVPDEGRITINGWLPGPETKAHVAYLPDREFLPQYMKIDQLLDFYQDFYQDFDRAKAGEMLAELGFRPGMDQKLKEMSKGTREKVQLVMTMSRRAYVYFLDEPIGGVDPAARDYILRTILKNYSEGSLVVISTHLIADVESILDDVIFLKQGHVILQKNADDLRTETGRSIDQLFREEFRC